MPADVEVLEDPGTGQFQPCLDHVALAVVHRVRDHVGREYYLVTRGEQVRGVPERDTGEDRAGFSLVTGYDRQELLLACLHHPPHGPVNGPPVPKNTRGLGEGNKFHLLGGDRVFFHGPPEEDRLPADLVGAFRDRLDTRNVRREGGDHDGVLVVLIACYGIAHEVPGDPFARAAPLPADVRRLDYQGKHAFLADLAEAGEVRRLADNRSPVKLEVQRIDDGTVRGMEDRGHRINDRVLGADKLENEILGERVPLPCLECKELVVNAKLLLVGDLLPDQFRCVWGRDDRGVVAVCQFRDRPDVVEVPVRAYNRLDGP